MLETVTHVSPHVVTLVLLLFGVGITVGNLLGARLSDWRQLPSVIALLALLVLTLVALFFAEPYVISNYRHGPLLGNGPLRLRARRSKHGSSTRPTGAPNLAATLNQGAFNLGNAVGASLGGLLLTSGSTYRELPWVSALITCAALALALVSRTIEHREAAAQVGVATV